MKIFDKYNCILCKYNKYNKGDDSCFNHQEKDEDGYPIGKCNSLSNIYHGTITKYFPFKQIDDFLTEIAWRKENKYLEAMDKKYGNYALETDDLKFIWGVKSWDDITSKDACMWTMNDIDITYDKKKKKYMLGIETAYMFKSYVDECDYLRNCLAAFTKYMDDNKLKKDEPYILFMNNPCTSIETDTIEELYTNFKIFVDGFCNQNIDMEDGDTE